MRRFATIAGAALVGAFVGLIASNCFLDRIALPPRPGMQQIIVAELFMQLLVVSATVMVFATFVARFTKLK